MSSYSTLGLLLTLRQSQASGIVSIPRALDERTRLIKDAWNRIKEAARKGDVQAQNVCRVVDDDVGLKVSTQPPLPVLPYGPFDRRQLPDVTLACLDCVDPDAGALALEYSMQRLDFARVVLFSDRRPARMPDGAVFIRVTRRDKDGYNLFCLRELGSHVTTSHVLTVQADGYVLDPTRWRDDWLQYDYIGAPWDGKGWWASKSHNGNSGFCLRSRRLLTATAHLATDATLSAMRREGRGILDDVFTCYDWHDRLVADGMAFAPVETCAAFSCEIPGLHGGSLDTAFGYHGHKHPYATWLRDVVTRKQSGQRIRLVTPWFRPDDPWRAEEYAACLRDNVKTPEIDEVHVVTDGADVPLANNKVCVHDGRRSPRWPSNGRHAMGVLVSIANERVRGDADISVVANADITLNSTLELSASMSVNEFWCLSRYEATPRNARLGNLQDRWSQDTWVWRGMSRVVCDDIPIGTPASDNVIAHRAREAGYCLRNPSLSVTSVHVHADVVLAPWQRVCMPGPRVFIWPHKIDEEAMTEEGKVLATEYRYVRQAVRAPFVVIISQPRSGTTWLRDLLNSCGCRVYHHIFQTRDPARYDPPPDPSSEPLVIWARRFLALASTTDGVLHGTVMHSSEQTLEVIDAIQRLATHIVLLRRDNHCRQYVSRHWAVETGCWSIWEKGLRPVRPALTIDRAAFDAYKHTKLVQLEEDRRRWAAYNTIEISYEEMCTNLGDVLNRLGNFLGRDLSGAKSESQQMEPRGLREIVANVDGEEFEELPDRIHYGCGRNVRDGWLNIDIVDESYPYGSVPPELASRITRVDLRERHPYEDDTFRFAYSEDFLEHLSQADGIKFLCEVYRCLQPGGVFRLSCPDLIARARKQLVGADGEQFCAAEYTRWHHKCLWTEETIRGVALQIGFQRCERMAYRKSTHPELLLDTRPEQADENLVVELTK